jgi:hypothetical protein
MALPVSNYSELPIDYLIALNQGLQEEQRISKQVKIEASRIDQDLDEKYHKLLDTMIKMSFLTKSVKSKLSALPVFVNVTCRSKSIKFVGRLNSELPECTSWKMYCKCSKLIRATLWTT